jgi:hypothetical protein
MSKYMMQAEFYEMDLAARREMHRLERRARRLLAQEPRLLEQGFQEEDPELDPSRIGMEAPTDQFSPEELVAVGRETEKKDRPSWMDWDEELPGSSLSW